MKTYLSSGLIILLPIILTVMIVNFLINFLTHPFLESTTLFLEKLPFFHQSFFLFHLTSFIVFSSKLFILLMLCGFVLLMGLLGNLFLINLFFRFSDFIIHRLPFINKIYKACQEVVHNLFSSSKQFSQVVFAPFPHTGSLSLGLVTNEAIILKNSEHGSEQFVSVFIPGTPNPSVGFMLLFKKEKLLFVNLKVEEAMKFIVSCGIVMPDFEIIHSPSEAYEK